MPDNNNNNYNRSIESKQNDKSPNMTGNFGGNVNIIYGSTTITGGQTDADNSTTGIQIQQQQYPKKPGKYRDEKNYFFGRKEYIKEIRKYFQGFIDKKNNNINFPLTIVGEGGIGKSAFAYKAIHECEDMFDVVIPIYLDSPTLMPSFCSILFDMARRLGIQISVSEFEKKDIEEQREIVVNALLKYNRVLIYVDHYETVKRAMVADNILASHNSSPATITTLSVSSSLLEDAPKKIIDFLANLPSNTYILLTSRRRSNNLPRERIIPLDGLTPEEGRDLFMDIARSKFPDGQVPRQIIPMIEALSIKTGGHPLSLEILASMYKGGLAPEIRTMLEHLESGVEDEGEEGEYRASLKKCFGFSLERLPQSHKTLLPKLIIFNSPFTAAAAAYVYDIKEGETTTILNDLYNYSLLRRMDFAKYGDIEGEYNLYYFHPSVRNYLENLADTKEQLEERYSEKLTKFFATFLQRLYNLWGIDKKHIIAIKLFNVIHEGSGNDFDRAIRLAGGHQEQQQHPADIAAEICLRMGLLLYKQGLLSKSLNYHEKALEIRKKLGDELGSAKDHNNIGLIFVKRREYDKALDRFNKSLKIRLRQKEQDKKQIAASFSNMGLVYSKKGELSTALSYYKDALELDKSIDNKAGIAADYNNIGNTYLAQGNYDKALDNYNKALDIHAELQNEAEKAGAYNNIGDVKREQGKLSEALDNYNKALDIHAELQNEAEIARAYRNMGLVYCKIANNISKASEIANNLSEALRHHNMSLNKHEDLEDKVEIAEDYRNIGTVFEHLGIIFDKMDSRLEALDNYNKALDIHAELQNEIEIAKDYRNIGVLIRSVPNLYEALRHTFEIEEFLKTHFSMELDFDTLSKLSIAKGPFRVEEIWSKICNETEPGDEVCSLKSQISLRMIETIGELVNRGNVQYRYIMDRNANVPKERCHLLKGFHWGDHIKKGTIQRKMADRCPVVMVFNKRTACICLPDLSGNADLNVGFYGDDPVFVKWCEDYFDRKWEESGEFNDKRFLCNNDDDNCNVDLSVT